MQLAASDFSGRVTFVTGPEKHCGKTTLLNAALGLLRAAGERPAFLGVGFDGEARDSLTAARKPRIRVEAGEVFVSAERYLRAAPCLPEILEALPGSSALGRLALARARRGGEVTLVGPERNEYAAWAIARIAEEAWARSVVVDGAINRITQVSAFSGARFLFALRAAPADLERQVRRMRLIRALAELPVVGRADRAAAAAAAGGGDTFPAAAPDRGDTDGTALDAAAEAAGLPAPAFALKGPLTAETARCVPESARSVVVDDFTKIFLDGPALEAFRRGRALAVADGIEFGGFSVVLRDLSRARFLEALGDGRLAALVAFNPYETEARSA
ncbi:MAG: hypothetical protein JNG85_10215 [Spirochaetaceae bacterium]|nr:hypothetical protein [Spirochaetaceae bacterium]